MIEGILATVSGLILSIIRSWGHLGIFGLMILEGSFVPLPSEIIMPFSGYLASQGVFSIWIIALIGACGNIIGTMFSYMVARYLGLPFLYKYGKFFLVSESSIDMAQWLFRRYGVPIVFVSRLLPGIRGFVPISAGIARMRLSTFVLYVFVGSYIWSFALAYIGCLAGENWNLLRPYFSRFDVLMLLAGIAFIAWIMYRRFSKRVVN